MQPVYSIIVPIYKVEEYIKKCIESVLEQDFEKYELILVDDGSPDDCPKICDKYAEKDKRIKVIHKKNGGLVSAKNAGLKEASGEYILYLDGDDWMKAGTLKKIFEEIIQKYSPDVIATPMTRVFFDKEVVDPYYITNKFFNKQQMEKDIYPYMMYDSRKSFYHGLIFPSSGGKIIKKKILQDHFCKEERIRMGEDNAYLFECVYYANSIFFSDISYYMYNKINENAMNQTYDQNRFDNNDILIKYIEKNLGELNKEIDKEINAFKAYWLIMAFFHEVKCKRKYKEIKKHVKAKIKEYGPMDTIDSKILPKSAKVFIVLLKHNCYFIMYSITRVLVRVRG